MKILFLSMSFSLESKNLYNDLIDALNDHGHQITIVCCAPKVDETYMTILDSNIKLLNVKTTNQFTKYKFKKGIDQLLIGYKIKKSIKKYLKEEEYALILYATPPITFNSVVQYCKKKYNAQAFLMLKDIFPQNALDLKMLSRFNPVYWWLRLKEKKLYTVSDHIGCMSQGNIDYILEHNPNIPYTKVSLFFNSIKIKLQQMNNYKIKTDKTVFLFGGNLGKPQNIQNLLEIINLLSNYSLAEFVIIGKGTEEKIIQQFIKKNNLNNLKYYDYMPQDEYEKFLEKVDIGIISLDPRFTIPNIPSKILSYMNLHKPILAITDRCTDLKEIISISNCGWWFDANNTKEIVNGIKYICEHKNEHLYKGENGFEYLKKYFDVEQNIKQLEKFMEETK